MATPGRDYLGTMTIFGQPTLYLTPLTARTPQLLQEMKNDILTPYVKHTCIMHVRHGNFLGIHYAQQRKECHRHQRRHRQRQKLQHPEEGHNEGHICTMELNFIV